MLYICKVPLGGSKDNDFLLSIKALLSKLSSQIHFKIKLSFLLGGMVVGTTSEILVEDGRLGIKEVCHVSEFRSFQCNHNTYGLCLGLVLSGKPHRVQTFGGFFHGWNQLEEGLIRESLATVLSVKGHDRGLWVKLQKLSRVLKSDRAAEFTEKNT